jgi:hypothetical protein
MGMLETQIRRVPEGKTREELIRQTLDKLADYFSDYENSCESYSVRPLTEQNFNEVWEVQETFKNTEEIRQKYMNLAREGKLVYVEIDY